MKITSIITNTFKAAIVALSLGSFASAQSLPEEICYDLKPERFDSSKTAVGFTDFVATPDTPGAPSLDVSDLSFDINYTGVAPTQFGLTGYCITWDPAETTIGSVGFNGKFPADILFKDKTYELCHTCYDFILDTSKFKGTVKLFDSVTKSEITPTKGPEGTILYNDILSTSVYVETEGEGNLVACFDDMKVCYCVPETSTTLMSLLGVSALLIRRKR